MNFIERFKQAISSLRYTINLHSSRQPLDLDYFEEAVDFMLSLPQVDKSHGVAVSGLSKAGEIVLSMAAFLPNEKLSGVIIMNSVMNYFVQDVMYKGDKVLSGKLLLEKIVVKCKVLCKI